MRFFACLATLFMSFISLCADKPSSDTKKTALYFISMPNDYIGRGQIRAYFEGKEGHFDICLNSDRAKKHITCVYNDIRDRESYRDNWRIEFSAPENQAIEPGIYRDAARFPFNEEGQPGFSFTGCGRGCNKSAGEFEILEIKQNNQGKLEAFAANFVQNCEVSGPPLFGCIRFNSSIPIEVKLSEILGENGKSALYLTKRSQLTGSKTQPLFVPGNKCTFQFTPLPHGEDGFQVIINDDTNGVWVFAFAVPPDQEISEGVYEKAHSYPTQLKDEPGLGIFTPEGDFMKRQGIKYPGSINTPNGSFKILNFKLDDNGMVLSMAANFTAQNKKGEVLEGAIRYNSTIPVNLDQPYLASE